MEKATRKRLIISLIYLTILTLLVWMFCSILKPKETCFDKIKNQNEESADCGGVCAPCKKIEASFLEVLETGAVESGVAGSYDFYAVVNNPNHIFGSPNFKYELKLKDSSGGIILSKTGEAFILPFEKKYIVENNLKTEIFPASVEFKILETQWNEFFEYYEKPQLEVVNKNYNEITGGVGFSEAKGLLKNKSPFDFDLIRMEVILKNKEGKVIALNSTEMRTVKSGEERDFRVYWPNKFSGEVTSVEAQTEVNIFKSDTFLKRYFKPQEFQKY